MSTKNILTSLVGVIIIGCAVYFSISKNSSDVTTNTIPPVRTSKEEIVAVQDGVPKEPAKDASSDEIIDYLIDGQSSDETKTAQASIDTVVPVAKVDPTITTNF